MPVLLGSTQRPRFPLRDMATVAFLSAAVWKASQKVIVGGIGEGKILLFSVFD
jgi:hypothetical protein